MHSAQTVRLSGVSSTDSFDLHLCYRLIMILVLYWRESQLWILVM